VDLRVDPVTSDVRLPDRADVVVIGGGIIGVSTALFLARRGVSVALCEKGIIGGEQSSRNWGWCRQMGRDHRELPLIVESLRLWREMDALVGQETGFRQCGILYLGETETDLARHGEFLEHAQPFQIGSRLIGADEVAKLLPGASRRWPGALYTASDGRAEPQKASPAIALGARAAGAKVFTRCAVRGIETAAGAVSAVVTERGRIACESVVLSGGAWSRLLCRRHDIDLPQLGVISTAMRTGPVEGGPEISTSARGFAFRKRLDGGYTITEGGIAVVPVVPDSFRFFLDFLPALRGSYRRMRLSIGRQLFRELAMSMKWPLDRPSPFEAVRVLDPAPRQRTIDDAVRNLAAAFPIFSKAKVEQAWAGAIDFTPDTIPVISGVDALPGFHLATGFSGHGFGIGPGAGRLMADIVTGADPVVDPTPFRYARFNGK
jgi:glycine/D-amino acid oxidase-like deaminating enzyme